MESIYITLHAKDDAQIEAVKAFMKALKIKFEISEEKLGEIIHQSQGNYNTALQLLNSDETADEFESLFIDWVRNAFMAKKKPEVLKNIIFWGRNISSWNREKQKNFLGQINFEALLSVLSVAVFIRAAQIRLRLKQCGSKLRLCLRGGRRCSSRQSILPELALQC